MQPRQCPIACMPLRATAACYGVIRPRAKLRMVYCSLGTCGSFNVWESEASSVGSVVFRFFETLLVGAIAVARYCPQRAIVLSRNTPLRLLLRNPFSLVAASTLMTTTELATTTRGWFKESMSMLLAVGALTIRMRGWRARRFLRFSLPGQHSPEIRQCLASSLCSNSHVDISWNQSRLPIDNSARRERRIALFCSSEKAGLLSQS